MEKDNLSNDVLKTIKDQKIKPTPKWQFLLKDYVIWGAGVVSVLVGAFAFAVVLYMVVNNDWDIYQYATNSLLGYIFSTLPYYWLLFLSIFIVIAYFNIRHTKKGYKYGLNMIIIISIGASIILGTVFYGLGLGQAIDNEFSKRVPIYKKFTQRNPQMWHKPGRGVIAGVVVWIGDEYNFKLKGLKGATWLVDSSSAWQESEQGVAVGDKIIVIGSEIIDNELKAKKILPWDRDKMEMMPSPMNLRMMDFHKIPK